MKTIKYLRAFTLIEILVAIAIIAILLVVALASFGHAYSDINRLRRITDLRTMQKALAEYAASNNGAYPISTGNGYYWNTPCVLTNGYPSGLTPPNSVIPGLVPAYLPVLPTDPDMDTHKAVNGLVGSCCYMYKSDGKDYKIVDANCSTAGYANPEFKSMNMVDPCRPGPSMPSFAIGVWTPGTLACTAKPPVGSW